jgi:HD-GYP domain-containing protein (c-di-GMP phosphodiesterase class II)
MFPVRVSEVLAALSLTTDLAAGLPFERGLAISAVADRLAGSMGLDPGDRQVAFYTALLGAVGCTSYASENAALFDDDIAFQATLRTLDPGDGPLFAAQMAQFGSWSGPRRQPELADRFLAMAATEGPRAMQASCEVSQALGPRLGLPEAAVDALADVHERWDGLGIPGIRQGEGLAVAMRIMHVAEKAVAAHARGGSAAAVSAVRAGAGTRLDPAVAETFAADAEPILAVLDTPDLVGTIVAGEPGLPVIVRPERLDELCLALSIVVDLKGRFLLGHSAHVAALADAAGKLSGLDPTERIKLRAAGLLHDLGRAAVPSSVWDRPGALGSADWERVRLHAYWTGRILLRCPALAGLASVAAGHHERIDGSGYHRGIGAGDQSVPARLLAAADVFAAATEPRPYRSPFPVGEAGRLVEAEVTAGRLDRDAGAATLEAAGLPRPRSRSLHDLTEREIEVLQLTARGLTNQQIADRLVVSQRTVGHHLAHIYDKTGRRSRAGAAVFAIEHGLLPE